MWQDNAHWNNAYDSSLGSCCPFLWLETSNPRCLLGHYLLATLEIRVWKSCSILCNSGGSVCNCQLLNSISYLRASKHGWPPVPGHQSLSCVLQGTWDPSHQILRREEEIEAWRWERIPPRLTLMIYRQWGLELAAGLLWLPVLTYTHVRHLVARSRSDIIALPIIVDRKPSVVK